MLHGFIILDISLHFIYSDSEWMDEHHGNDNENSEPEEATASDNQDSYDTETVRNTSK